MTYRTLLIPTFFLLLSHVFPGILPVQAVNPRVIPGVLKSPKRHDSHLDSANSTRRDRWTQGMDSNRDNSEDSAATESKLARQNPRDILNTTLDTVSDLLGTPLLGGGASSGQKFVVAQ